MRLRYFVVKTDQHTVEPGRTLNRLDTAGSAERLCACIGAEPVEIEAVVDLGDVADTVVNPDRVTAVGTVESYTHARSILGNLPGIQLYLPGNHDDPSLLFDIMGNHWAASQDGVYTYKLGGICLVGIDARVGPEPVGLVRAESLRELEQVLQRESRVILFSHYSWHEVDNRRINEGLRITNHGPLRALLTQYRGKILAFFHGHLHQWWSAVVDGIPIFTVPGSAFPFDLPPHSPELEKIIDAPVGYLLVGVSEEGSILVRQRFI